jgi:hypothetical protein
VTNKHVIEDEKHKRLVQLHGLVKKYPTLFDPIDDGHCGYFQNDVDDETISRQNDDLLSCEWHNRHIPQMIGTLSLQKDGRVAVDARGPIYDMVNSNYWYLHPTRDIPVSPYLSTLFASHG